MNNIPARLHRPVLIASVALLSLAAAACGSKAGTSPAATTTPTTTAAPVTTVQAMTTETPMTTDATAMHMLEPKGPGCQAVPATGMGSFAGMLQDPAGTAASHNPVLSTLVAAVVKAGLVDTLNGPGPFTIFAPTNDAFAKIPADKLAAVLADKNLLTSVLTFHVVAGASMSSADLVTAGTVTTVNGAKLTITDNAGTLTVNGVPTVCMDVHVANGTVHIISGVLMP